MEDLRRRRPYNLGTTFSQLQCNYLGLNYKEAFHSISRLGLSHMRICAYWSEIEPTPGQYDFTKLDWLLEQCEKHSLNIVLAVGMKTPRWPEFHFPKWIENDYATSQSEYPLDTDIQLREHALTYFEQLVDHTKHTPISYWQVENEALSKPGVANSRNLSREFVQLEIDIVKRVAGKDSRILLTNSVDMLPFGNEDKVALNESIPIADAIGLNVYTKVPLNEELYLDAYPFFWEKLADWQSILIESGKEAWVVEAQAEPWEWNKLVAVEKSNYPSASPESAIDLTLRLGGLGYNTVFLWGCEYWYWQKKQGNPNWLNAIDMLIDM